MNNYNRNNTPQNFNFNNNNTRGFSGNNNNMRGFPGNNNMRGLYPNNSYLEQTMLTNWAGNNLGTDFWSNMNYDRSGQLNSSASLPPLLSGLLANLSGSPMLPFTNSVGGGGGGQGSVSRRSNSRYSPQRSRNTQSDLSKRLVVAGATSTSNSGGKNNSEGARRRRPPTDATQLSKSQLQTQTKGSTNSKGPKKSADAKKGKSAATEKKPLEAKKEPKFPMVLMPVDYPKRVLNQEELLQLECAIVDEIAKGWEIEPEFSGMNFKAGCLHVTCINEATSKWLEDRVLYLENWQGVPLKACSREELPKVNTITISFPRSAGQDVSKTLALVAAQNKDISTSSWKVLNHKDEDKMQLLTIAIDDECLEAITKKENILNYRFGHVIVQSVKQQPVKSEAKSKESTETKPKGEESTESEEKGKETPGSTVEKNANDKSGADGNVKKKEKVKSEKVKAQIKTDESQKVKQEQDEKQEAQKGQEQGDQKVDKAETDDDVKSDSKEL